MLLAEINRREIKAMDDDVMVAERQTYTETPKHS